MPPDSLVSITGDKYNQRVYEPTAIYLLLQCRWTIGWKYIARKARGVGKELACTCAQFSLLFNMRMDSIVIYCRDRYNRYNGGYMKHQL